MSRRPARLTAGVAPRPDVRRWFLVTATVATAAAFASVAGAQDAPSTAPMQATRVVSVSETAVSAATGERAETSAATSRSSSVGPRLGGGLVTYKPAVTSQFEAATATERELMRPASRRNAALIVVGLSAMVIGSLVDDDAGSLIVLGGAGVTLYGLWQYLK